MEAPFVYRLHTALLCVDRQAHTLVSLEPGSVVTYLSPEDRGMVAVRRAGARNARFRNRF
jgi:hypothetical protein